MKARAADIYAGTLVKMPADGSCLLHSLKLGDAVELRKKVMAWLKANPHHPLPFQASTLSFCTRSPRARLPRAADASCLKVTV